MSIQGDENEEKINVRDRLTDNVLDLSVMNITKIPVEDIKVLRRATTLDLSNNRITSIESNFTDITQLTQLDLSKNRITSICDDFGLLTNLRRLDLYNNQITQLPLTFGRLRNLKYLDLKNNPLHPAFKKLIGTCSDTQDCLTAAGQAVDFMKHVERQVVDGRIKEREQREELERVAQQEQQKKEKLTAEGNPTDDSKQDNKGKRKKAPTEALDVNTAQHGGESRTGEPNLTGWRISSVLWIVFALLLAVGILLHFLKHSDALQTFWVDTFGTSRDAILEEYIK